MKITFVIRDEEDVLDSEVITGDLPVVPRIGETVLLAEKINDTYYFKVYGITHDLETKEITVYLDS